MNSNKLNADLETVTSSNINPQSIKLTLANLEQ